MKKILFGLASGLLLVAIVGIAGAQVTPPGTGQTQPNECCLIKHNISAIPPDTGQVNKGSYLGPQSTAVCVFGGTQQTVTSNQMWAAYCTVDSITTISDWIFWIVLVVSGIVIVASGAMFMTAAGDPEKTTKARKILTFGVVGLIVAILAKFIPAIARYFISI